MRDAHPNAIYLKDYQQPDYWIEHTELTFELSDDHTLVTARLDIVRNSQRPARGCLTVQGQELELLSGAL